MSSLLVKRIQKYSDTYREVPPPRPKFSCGKQQVKDNFMSAYELQAYMVVLIFHQYLADNYSAVSLSIVTWRKDTTWIFLQSKILIQLRLNIVYLFFLVIYALLSQKKLKTADIMIKAVYKSTKNGRFCFRICLTIIFLLFKNRLEQAKKGKSGRININSKITDCDLQQTSINPAFNCPKHPIVRRHYGK